MFVGAVVEAELVEADGAAARQWSSSDWSSGWSSCWIHWLEQDPASSNVSMKK